MAVRKNSDQFQSVVVTGDVTVDNYIYEGERFSARKVNVTGVRLITKPGGAFLTYKILNELISKKIKEKPADEEKNFEQWRIIPGFIDKENKDSTSLSSFSLWKLFPVNGGKFVWRMSRALGYGDNPCDPEFEKTISPKELITPKNTKPKILVIDDAGYKFGNVQHQKKWPLFEKFDWIVLKMTGKVACDDLWTKLFSKYSNKLIVIVSAAELRGEDYQIARGTSWEQTIEDTRNVLLSAHNISNLKKCRHLILSYNNDGVLWLENINRKRTVARLLCDTTRAENEWSESIHGKAFGYLSCLTSAITFKLISKGLRPETQDFINGIESGLSAMRNLLEFGHGDSEQEPSGFPFKRIADEIIKPQYFLSCIPIPWQHSNKEIKQRKWMITEMLQRSPSLKEEVPLHGLATQVILYGTKILKYIPHAKFRKHATADRFEIEALRSIRYFMISYRDNLKTNKPISFGVFGPPGAGKSFGVKQIATEIFGEDSWLEFNLSQFSTGSLAELHGAFHQVRDKVLAGIIPVVFMDEFDSKQYEWLQYLLSPMQDGEFQEGQLTHSIGKCIFIFAGATSHSFESLGNFKNVDDGKAAQKDFVLKKGPDFKSRLDTYLNVLGPNKRVLDFEKNETDPNDITYPLRRAIFIASKIKYESYLPAQVDPGLINALLRIPKYIHGARSLDKLLSLLLSSDGTGLERTRIPADSQLSVYVDPAEFNRLLTEPQKNRQEIPIEELARAIHDTYWLQSAKKNKIKITKEFNKIYDNLDEEKKEDNRAAARRIQDILATVNLKIEKITASSLLKKNKSKVILNHILFHIELLSALEHNGWWMQRIKTGWRFAETRDNDNKLHHLLIPYSDLPNFEKEKDRTTIRSYQKMLNDVGYQINWMK